MQSINDTNDSLNQAFQNLSWKGEHGGNEEIDSSLIRNDERRGDAGGSIARAETEDKIGNRDGIATTSHEKMIKNERTLENHSKGISATLKDQDQIPLLSLLRMQKSDLVDFFRKQPKKTLYFLCHTPCPSWMQLENSMKVTEKVTDWQIKLHEFVGLEWKGVECVDTVRQWLSEVFSDVIKKEEASLTDEDKAWLAVKRRSESWRPRTDEEVLLNAQRLGRSIVEERGIWGRPLADWEEKTLIR